MELVFKAALKAPASLACRAARGGKLQTAGVPSEKRRAAVVSFGLLSVSLSRSSFERKQRANTHGRIRVSMQVRRFLEKDVRFETQKRDVKVDAVGDGGQ
jgi:hypothetical protein